MLHIFKKRPKIIILGAGLSGLMSAYLLRRHHFEVVVLEARDRVGGRIFTKHIPTNPELTVEMGAEWIGKTHHRMHRLVHQLGLHLIDHRFKTALYLNDKYFKPGEWEFSKKWREILKQKIKQFSSLSEKELEELETIDLWHFLATNHVPKRDMEVIGLIRSTDFGEDIRFISSETAFSDYSKGGDPTNASFYRINGGNDQLPIRLATKIGSNHIHLNKLVSKISQHENSVEVECADGTSYTGAKIISSLPAQMLAGIDWDPLLPDDQKRAYEALNYSRVIKSSVLFRERFWKSESFEVMSDTLSHEIYHSTQNQLGSEGVLTSYSIGDKAYVLSNLSDELRKKELCDTLKNHFGPIENLAETQFSYYWGDDPYSKGAYAIFEKNYPLENFALLKQPHLRTFFAGEHTAEIQGFMEGALESAERVVEEVLKSR